MKIRNIIIAILFFVLYLPGQSMAQEKVKEAVNPQIVIDNPVYTFESVPEGMHVVHEFLIKNKGEAPLYIEKVLPP